MRLVLTTGTLTTTFGGGASIPTGSITVDLVSWDGAWVEPAVANDVDRILAEAGWQEPAAAANDVDRILAEAGWQEPAAAANDVDQILAEVAWTE